MDKGGKPLITFVVLVFNQEKFVAEAVSGALSQTYAPLEVILSDDASTDGSFAILSSLSRKYTGPHSLILNQNPRQLGIGGHLDKVFSLAHGELIVLAAGDDISLPERAERLFRFWDSSGRRPTSIYSDYIAISESGHAWKPLKPCAERNELIAHEEKVELAYFVSSLEPNVYGCTHAFVPRLYSVFGPLTDRVAYEDMALSFRSHAIGSLLRVREPLVLYRRHEANVSFHALERHAMDGQSFRRIEEKERKRLLGFIRGYERFESDLQTLVDGKHLSAEAAGSVKRAILEGKQALERDLVLMDGNLIERTAAFVQQWRSGSRAGKLAGLAPRCLPRQVYKWLRILKNRSLPSSNSYE